MASKPKLLVCELWGIGDLTLATALIDKARGQFEVHVLAKPHARELLGSTYPDTVFHSYNAPWTAHYRKYHLWNWHWNEFFRIIADLRKEKFNAAVSVRKDPRDHFLMWVGGARRRIGFPIKGSGVFLHECLREPEQKWHRVESYRELGRRLQIVEIDTANPRIDGNRDRTDRVTGLLGSATKATVTVHLGAGQPVRRWPVEYWRQIIEQLRQQFDFHLIVVPDQDGFGAPLRSMADGFIDNPNVRELVDLMARSKIVLCHDSGPMHVAAACGVPTIAIFGPGEVRWFRPWGDDHQIIIRDICPYRPCFDFCRFAENFCLTRMPSAEVWPEIRTHFERLMASPRLGTPTSRSNALRR
jgi:ADP-heptose:LPS heptosyltransferase